MNTQTSTPTKRRNPTLPARVLVSLLYSDLGCIEQNGLQYHLRTGKYARCLCVSTFALRKALRWLRDTGYIRDLEVDYGYASFTLVVGAGFTRILHSLATANARPA